MTCVSMSPLFTNHKYSSFRSDSCFTVHELLVGISMALNSRGLYRECALVAADVIMT